MNVTPAMQQYYDLKKQHKDAILFFRMGDFYEMFEEDAQIAHNILGIALTTRNKNSEHPIPLAGIPYHAKDKYLSQFINAGYKVAIAEQVSDPKLKGIVQREVVRVVTPSTLQLESNEYDNTELSAVLLSITCSGEVYGLSYLDIAKNIFICSEFQDISKLCESIYKIYPSEVILEKSLFGQQDLLELLQKKYTLNTYYYELQSHPEEKICNFFGVKNLDSFGIRKYKNAQCAAAQLIEYLEKHQKSDVKFIDKLTYESFSGYMGLDENTIRSLDLVYNFATNSQKSGTLLGILDQTKTSMGRRNLREQILHPLQDIKEIKERQNYIKAFLGDKKLLDSVSEKLKYVADLDAILNRISLNRAGVKDLIQLKKSLQSIVEIKDIIDASGNKQLQKIFK